MMSKNTLCRYFNGYKPCSKSHTFQLTCDEKCSQLQIPSHYILITHLGAIGAVVRSTSLLIAIKRKYPNSHITWVTDKPSDQLLRAHPLIDRVFTTTHEDLLALKILEFDIGFCIDKSLKAISISQIPKVDFIYGFTALSNGAIVPSTLAAQELWELGIDNNKKFFVNQKPETQLMIEALELGPYQRDEYFLFLNEQELEEVQRRRSRWSLEDKILIGVNTGCSAAIPYKKLTIDANITLIEKLLKDDKYNVVLLGGPEDTLRNQKIYTSFKNNSRVINSETEKGLRDGLISVKACDVIITGDSLGMHLGIAMRKWIVAWFGPTCAHEIDLYDRGVKILTNSTCAPCWKRSCEKENSSEKMCYDQVNLDDILLGVNAFGDIRTKVLDQNP